MKQNKNNTPATANTNNNALSVISAGMFETKQFVEGDGTITVNVKGEGNALVSKAKLATDIEVQANKALAKLETMGKEITIAKCYYLSKLKDFAVSCNYKSVGAYMASNFDDYKVGTCNQYARIGEAYLQEIVTESGEIVIDYKREWLKGVSPSVLLETLSLLDNEFCNGDIDKFYERYIKTGMVNVDLSAQKVRKQCEETGEKPNAKKSSGKQDGKQENKQENKPAEMSPLACLSKVEAWVLAHETLVTYSDEMRTMIAEIAKAMQVFEETEDTEA